MLSSDGLLADIIFSIIHTIHNRPRLRSILLIITSIVDAIIHSFLYFNKKSHNLCVLG